MPLIETRGALTSRAYGEFSAPSYVPAYVEDVFSTNLYTQNDTGVNISVPSVSFQSTLGWQSNAIATVGQQQTCCAVAPDGSYFLAASNSVFKFNSSGSLVWKVQITTPSNALIADIAAGASGAVYVCGTENYTANPWLLKLSSSGTVSWTYQNVSGGFYWSNQLSIALDSSENVFLCYVTGSLTVAYFKFNSSSGAVLNSAEFTCLNQFFVNDVAVDSSNNVYICGRAYNSAAGEYWGTIAKFNSSMALSWIRGYRVTAGESDYKKIGVDSSGNVYALGSFRPATYDAAVVTKLNSSGVLQSHTSYSETGASISTPWAFAVLPDGSFCASGKGYVWFCTSGSTSPQWVSKLLTGPLNYPGISQIEADASGNLYLGCATNNTGTNNNYRAQCFKLNKADSFSATTPYGSFFQSTLTTGTPTVSANNSLSVSSSSTGGFSYIAGSVSNSSASDLFYSQAASTSTGGIFMYRMRAVADSNNLTFSNTQILQTTGTSAPFTTGNAAKLVSNGAIVPPNYNANALSVGWSFAKKAKFFDIVTYTGDGSGSRFINHSLGSAPGLVIIKATSTTSNWPVMMAPTTGNAQGFSNAVGGGGLNSNASGYSLGSASGVSTATQFRVGATYWGAGSQTNDSGVTYIAYLFANNAGGFGASGTDSIVRCGSFTHTYGGSDTTVNLGWEPQFLLIKRLDDLGDWQVYDTMRGFGVSAGMARYLRANTTAVEVADSDPYITNTGFYVSSLNWSSGTWIYMAIRRGPMRTPTSGTSVFSPVTYTGTGSYPITVGSLNAVDFSIVRDRSTAFWHATDRLRNGVRDLYFNANDAETTWTGSSLATQSGFTIGSITNDLGGQYVNYAFRRSPGFFDVVCYAGTGSNLTVSHNLGAVPQMMWVKTRTGVFLWGVYDSFNGATKFMRLNGTNGSSTAANYFNNTSPTSSVFTVGTALSTASENYVAYLFGSVSGVSRFGNYTGTGSAQTIDCGFTGGARFIIIKRSDTNSDWYVWDTARGITAGNDPYLLLNVITAETAGTNYISVQSSGFGLTATAPADLNANGGSYIFFAIA